MHFLDTFETLQYKYSGNSLHKKYFRIQDCSVFYRQYTVTALASKPRAHCCVYRSAPLFLEFLLKGTNTIFLSSTFFLLLFLFLHLLLLVSFPVSLPRDASMQCVSLAYENDRAI